MPPLTTTSLLSDRDGRRLVAGGLEKASFEASPRAPRPFSPPPPPPARRASHPSLSVGVASAGIEAGTGVKEGAAIVMEESGVPIAHFPSDAMADFDASLFDYVISCCGCGTRCDGTNFDPAAPSNKFEFDDWNLD